MKIILTDIVKNLGRTGDVVNVKDGYARNFLIPNSLAVIADEKNVKQTRHHKTVLERKLSKQLDEMRGYAGKIEATEISISRKAGENGKLFGSVTNQDIQAELQKAGIDIDRKMIVVSDPIKAIGTHTVTIKLAPEVEAKLKFQVVEEKSSETPAEQA